MNTTPNPDPVSDAMPNWPKVETDYQGALLRLATMQAGSTHYLLFGWVELFPRDIPVPTSFHAGDKPWTVPGSKGIRLGASATAMTVVEALSWYEAAARGRVVMPSTNRLIEIMAPTFGIEPTFGRFSVDVELPFAPHWHNRPRIHRLVPMTGLEEIIYKVGLVPEARKWLRTYVGIDPFDFEEWLGSLSLLAPDPLLSGVGHFSQPLGENREEQLVLQAHRRRFESYPDGDAENLQLVVLQRRPSGWTEVLPVQFDQDGFAIKSYPEPTSETGYAISCPERGLIRMIAPTFWIGQVKVDIGLVNTVLDVEVPAEGRRKPAARYKTCRIVPGGSTQVGEALPPSGAIRVAELKDARSRRIMLQSAPQRLFGILDKTGLDEEDLSALRAKAENYIAELVADARRRVIFVDPEFGCRQMQNYAFRAQRDGVTVKILTGIRRMQGTSMADRAAQAEQPKPSDEGTSPTIPGIEMLEQLKLAQGKFGDTALEVFVMPGSDRPVFHDRFLVIDDVVWFSGPSFNELGERIGLLSRAHEPSVIISAINQVLGSSLTLATWIDAETRPQNRAPDAPNL